MVLATVSMACQFSMVYKNSNYKERDPGRHFRVLHVRISSLITPTPWVLSRPRQMGQEVSEG